MASFQQGLVFVLYGLCATYFLHQHSNANAFILQLQDVQEEEIGKQNNQEDAKNDNHLEDLKPTIAETTYLDLRQDTNKNVGDEVFKQSSDDVNLANDDMKDRDNDSDPGDDFANGDPDAPSNEILVEMEEKKLDSSWLGKEDQGMIFKTSQDMVVLGDDESELDGGVESGITNNRTRRAVQCGQSPPGVDEPCVSCNGESKFFYTDVNGHTCQCDVCRPPKYMLAPCICTVGGGVESGPICSLPKLGEEYMDVSNWCSRPFKCSKCKGNLEVKIDCTSYEDTKCGCPRNTYPTSATNCEPIPACPKDQEIREVPARDSPYSIYECIPCEPGYTQPYDDSLERCRPVEENRVRTEPPGNDEPTDGQNKEEILAPTPSASNAESSEPSQAPSDQSITNCPSECQCPDCPKMPECPTEKVTTDKEVLPFKDTSINDDNGKSMPMIWYIPIIAILIIIFIYSIMLALVYGSNHPEEVKSFMRRLKIPGWIYGNSSDTNSGVVCQHTDDSGSSVHVNIPSEKTRLTENTDDYNDHNQPVPSNDAEEATESSTNGHPVIDDSSSTGGRLDKAQKYVRERSKPTRECSLNGEQTYDNR